MKDTANKELYAHQIRMQLSFFSFMKLALLVCITVSILFTILLNLMMSPEYHQAIAEIGAVFWLNVYLILGSLGLELLASVLAFAVYWYWCSGHRGHVATGKFALLVEEKDKK